MIKKLKNKVEYMAYTAEEVAKIIDENKTVYTVNQQVKEKHNKHGKYFLVTLESVFDTPAAVMADENEDTADGQMSLSEEIDNQGLNNEDDESIAPFDKN